MNYTSKSEKNTTIKLVYIAMFIALSFIGSLIKIQGTIALDSMSAFFASLYLGPAAGAIVGALGHLFTAFTSGFPLTIPIHLVIMLQMSVIVYIFGYLYKKYNGLLANVVAILLNGPGAVFMIAPIATALGLPLSGAAFIYAMIGVLTIGSIVNIVLASLLFGRMKKR